MDMTAKDKLIDRIINFSSEELKQFLNNQVTQLILQPEAEVESSHPTTHPIG